MLMTTVVKTLGTNRQRFEVQDMVLALSMHSWHNTPEEMDRLEAAKTALRDWRAYRHAATEAWERVR